MGVFASMCLRVVVLVFAVCEGFEVFVFVWPCICMSPCVCVSVCVYVFVGLRMFVCFCWDCVAPRETFECTKTCGSRHACGFVWT